LTTTAAQRTTLRHELRRVALFGGSFDPVHSGHLAVARAADRRFNFDEVHFVVASQPPHKLNGGLAPFAHRFAMVALACSEHPHFLPSLAEADEAPSGGRIFYSVDTVRQFRRIYHGPGDRLFFILGADAFLDLPLWREYETLLGLCDFIVASRPGIRARALRQVIPPELFRRPLVSPSDDPPQVPVIAQLRRSAIYLLDAVSSEVSSTDIRRRASRGQSIHGLVSARVEEYILKQGLYRER
jgi:nicotinate-nucleotide adenylyltransferase